MVLCAIGLYLKNGKVEYILVEWSSDLENDLETKYNNRDLIIGIFQNYNTTLAENYYTFFNINNLDIDYYYFFTNKKWHLMAKKYGITYPRELNKILINKNFTNEINNMLNNMHL
jgi:hypothetical protein